MLPLQKATNVYILDWRISLTHNSVYDILNIVQNLQGTEDILTCILRYDIFVGVGVMCSGEYEVCDVTLSVHPHRAG